MTGRWHWRALAAGGVITAAVIFGSAAPAMAASPAGATPTSSACNATVLDTTTGKVLGDASAVAQAAAKLQAKGADVRVRVMDTAPGGSLDTYVSQQVAACSSWRFGDTGFSYPEIKPNLLVFVVSRDHQDAVFYGANYSRMKGQVDQIRADMGADFRDGDFAAGISKGERETYSALYPSGTPAWLVIAIAVGIILVLGIAVCAIASGGGSYGPGRGGVIYISTGGGWDGWGGGGFSSGGSSGSW